MIQSQFNLDHRLAELRQTGIELRQERTAQHADRSSRTLGATVRSLLGITPTSGRPAGVAAA